MSNSSHTLVKGTQILDLVCVENEAMDTRLKGKKALKVVICKMNIEKAYNHVSWSLSFAIIK